MRTPIPAFALAIALAAPMAPNARAQAPDSTKTPAPARADSLPPAPPDTAQAPAPARADRVPPAPRDSVLQTRGRSVADTVTVLPPVHVDTERAITPDRTTGTSVRLDRSRLVRFQPVSTGDALRAAPGVDLVKTGSWDTRVSLRGLSGERVLVMVDGVRLQTGRGHGAQLSLVPLDQIESIELQPGGGSTQFGSDALAGVVNLVTHRSLFADESRATVTLMGRVAAPGDGDGAHSRLRWMSRRAGIELSGGFDRIGSLVTPEGTLPNSASHDRDLAVRGAAQLWGATVDAEHSHHRSYDIGLPAFSTSIGGSGAYPLQQRDADRVELSSPERGLRPELRVLAVAQSFRSAFDELTVESLMVRRVLRGWRLTDSQDHVTTWSRSLQPSLRRGPLRLYGELRRETTGGPRRVTVTTLGTNGQPTTTPAVTDGQSVPPANRTVFAGGAYLGGSIRGVRLEAGGRYDHQHAQADSLTNSFTSKLDVTDRRWSFEGGAARAFGAWTPYVHAGSGFRAPNLEERYFSGPFHGTMLLFGNPDLHPERTFTTELGLRASEAVAGHLVGARVSVYRTHADELISLKYLGMLYGVSRFQNVNVRKARLEGVELEADTRVRGLQLAATAAFPRGRDLETGEPIQDLGTAHATIDVRVPMTRALLAKLLPQGALALRARWTNALPAPQADQPELARPADWTADAELSATVLGGRVALAVRNLANTRYREPLSFIDEPGRSVALSMRRDLSFAAFAPREH
jgi:outer membrane receptor protein involved in Fe transport